MRKLLLTIAVVCSFIGILPAQYYLVEKFSLSATGKDYGIFADINAIKEQAPYQYMHIDMDSPNSKQEVKLEICYGTDQSKYAINIFIESLSKTKDYFKRWSLIAKENNMKLIKFKIPVRFSDQKIYFTQDGKWYSERGVDMQAFFYVDRSGDCYIVLESDYMTSKAVVAESSSFSYSMSGGAILGFGGSSGRVVAEKYCSGSSLVFSSEKEIEDFIDALNKAVQWKRQNLEFGKLLK